MANWVMATTERYLSLLYDRLHGILCRAHTVQADETTVEVAKDGRSAGSKSYMWLYRTGEYDQGHPVILYDYRKTRATEHPMEFLKDFKGTLVCDGYSAYHRLEDLLPWSENLPKACFRPEKPKKEENSDSSTPD